MLGHIDTSLIDWSRAQFALTAIYHWIFVPLTLGLAVIMGIMETAYYRTGDEFWKRTAKFWMKIFGINFAIGVATGIILEFEFGTNWSNYSWFVGDIFGAPLQEQSLLLFRQLRRQAAGYWLPVSVPCPWLQYRPCHRLF